jgi:hypothetical protein
MKLTWPPTPKKKSLRRLRGDETQSIADKNRLLSSLALSPFPIKLPIPSNFLLRLPTDHNLRRELSARLNTMTTDRERGR